MKWETQWIETAEKIVRDEFMRSYASYDVEVVESPSSIGLTKGSHS